MLAENARFTLHIGTAPVLGGLTLRANADATEKFATSSARNAGPATFQAPASEAWGRISPENRPEQRSDSRHAFPIRGIDLGARDSSSNFIDRDFRAGKGLVALPLWTRFGRDPASDRRESHLELPDLRRPVI